MARGELVHLVDARGPCAVSTPLLVVEDDPQLRHMMVLLLEDEGYPVDTAADGWTLSGVCRRAARHWSCSI
jgi:DNA-binding NtrC family response regulator